jgi:hypothetical protein
MRLKFASERAALRTLLSLVALGKLAVDEALEFFHDDPRTVAEFQPDEEVLYVPYHAHHDEEHPDCEAGVVSSTNDTYVFVRFKRADGTLKQQAQACKPDQLVKRSNNGNISAERVLGT